MQEGIEMTEENITSDYWILLENLYGKKGKMGENIGQLWDVKVLMLVFSIYNTNFM